MTSPPMAMGRGQRPRGPGRRRAGGDGVDGRGGAELAAALLAQREILEIDLAYERARAEHGAAWARLEAAVGRPLERAIREEAGDE